MVCKYNFIIELRDINKEKI